MVWLHLVILLNSFPCLEHTAIRHKQLYHLTHIHKKHKDIKLYFIVKNQQPVGHNHEVERHLLDISNFFNKSKTEKLGSSDDGYWASYQAL